MKSKRQLSLAATLLLVSTVAQARSAAPAPEEPLAPTCQQEAWEIQAKDATGQAYSMDSFKGPVVVFFYENQKNKDLNEPLKEALKADPLIGKAGDLRSELSYVGMANYKEIWAPNFLVSFFLKLKIKKYGVTILDDKDRCFSGNGFSKRCVAGSRKPYFKTKEANIAVVYQGKLLKNFVGEVKKENFLPYLHFLTQSARNQKNFCWIQANTPSNENQGTSTPSSTTEAS